MVINYDLHMDGFMFNKIKKQLRLAQYGLFVLSLSVNGLAGRTVRDLYMPPLHTSHDYRCDVPPPVLVSQTNSNSVHVGAANFLLVSGLNIGDIAAYAWSSSDPSVAAVSDAQPLEARINGLMPGIAEIYYSVTLTDGMESEASFVLAVTPALRLSVQTDTSDIRCGDFFSLDVVASDYFDHLLALQFSVNWNPAELQMLSASAAPVGLVSPVTFFEQTAGYAAFAWSDVASVFGVDMPDGTVLMTLHFRVKGNVSATPVAITGWPAPLEATNAAAVAFQPDTPAPLKMALIPLQTKEIPDQLGCPQGNFPPVLLQALPANDPTIQYAWSGGAAAGLPDGSSTGPHPFIPGFTVGSIPGVYPVRVIAERQGCADSLGFSVYVLDAPSALVCNDTLHLSLDADCEAILIPDMILEGANYCYNDYRVALIYPPGTDTFSPPNKVNATHFGKTILARLIHAVSGNLCVSVVRVEDKLSPELSCPDNRTVACSESTDPAYTGTVSIADCSATTTQINNQILDNGACGNPRQIIERVFRVTDAWGNQSECAQIITVLPLELSDVV
ncbi:MAG: hypothetical protein ACR2K1_02875, partial [Saprospiraceae bacterium]